MDNEKINDLSSNSSIQAGKLLFIDDELFKAEYSNITDENYTSEDFPGSDLVDKNLVFAKEGYTTPKSPYIKYSVLSLVLSVFSIFIPFVSLLSLLLAIAGLSSKYTRFHKGLKLIRSALIISILTSAMWIWIYVILKLTYSL